MKKIAVILTSIAVLMSCSAQKKATVSSNHTFPAVDQDGKIAIVAHRGYWKCEAAQNSENSIASLKAAQDLGFWGSECDVHLTKDGEVIVNHNDDIEGAVIAKSTFAELSKYLLPNGERRPTLDEYLTQAEKSKKTKLIIEFKKQPTAEIEDRLVDITMKKVKEHGLYSPDRVLFISFSLHVCQKLAAEYPQFVNQYLTMDVVSDESPEKYAAMGINGIDYRYNLFQSHKDWVERAHAKGMSVNVWTVNKKEVMTEMINLGVDAITTNYPEKLRKLLGEKEYRR